MLKILAAAGLMVGASYAALVVAKGQLAQGPAQEPPRLQLAGTQASAPVQAHASGTVALPADSRGHFSADVGINGARIPMLVDTGASIIALSAEDAQRAGVFTNPADYRVPVGTANGSVNAAPVRLREVRLDRITVRDVEAVVLPPGRLKTSLLGMSFLQKLSGFSVANNTLLLRQ